jgi:signal transduction histidine kinase
MNTLIEYLLDGARAEQGGLAVSCRAIAPAPLLVEAADSQRSLASELGLELRLDVEEALPEIWGDPERLLQVITNLTSNALKFTPRGGTITIGGCRRGDDVVFRVEDTGRGIAEALLPHVFDRFWQANPDDRRGAGLGLSIVKSIVERHRGTVSVESTPGVGTTFRFTVPIAAPLQTSDAEHDHYAS